MTSISTAAFDGYPLEVALDEIAALGLRLVEPAYIQGYTEFDESVFGTGVGVRRALEARGLSAQAVSAHMDLSEAGADEMLARRIGFAGEVGAPILITNAGPALGREAILATIAHALPTLTAAGIILALENPGQGSGHLIGCGEDGAALVVALGHPLVRLNVDVGNLFTATGEVAGGLAAALPFAAHTHLKDVAEEGADWHFVALGDGLVDVAAVGEAMQRLAPGLSVGIELPLRLSRPGRGDPVPAAEAVPLPLIREAVRRSVDAWARAC